MKTGLRSRLAGSAACLLLFASAPLSFAESGNCSEIANDVSAAITKDPSKVLMIVEDALVINEGCAGDIVKAAITASKADATLANQIVQTASSVAPKQVVAINAAATSVVPGLVVASASGASEQRPVAVVSGKNPGKNPVLNSPDPEEKTLDSPDPFFTASPRGIMMIQPPIAGPLPQPPAGSIPVSPSVAN